MQHVNLQQSGRPDARRNAMTKPQTPKITLIAEHSQIAPLDTPLPNRNDGGSFGHADIAQLAHELWQSRGCPDGSADEDWFQAARELRGDLQTVTGYNVETGRRKRTYLR